MKKIVVLMVVIVVLMGCTVTKVVIIRDGKKIDYHEDRSVPHNVGFSFDYSGCRARLTSDNVIVADSWGLPVRLDRRISSGYKVVLDSLYQGHYSIDVEFLPIEQYEELLSSEKEKLKGKIDFEVGPEGDIISFYGQKVQKVLKIEDAILLKSVKPNRIISLEELSNDHEIWMRRMRKKAGFP